jgi:hypothetical protein
MMTTQEPTYPASVFGTFAVEASDIRHWNQGEWRGSHIRLEIAHDGMSSSRTNKRNLQKEMFGGWTGKG